MTEREALSPCLVPLAWKLAQLLGVGRQNTECDMTVDKEPRLAYLCSATYIALK
jgi:hypothetical protein